MPISQEPPVNLMTECSCAVVLVEGITFLCLPQGRALFAPAAPWPRAERFGSPLEDAQVVQVLQGGAQEDFCWLIVTTEGSIQADPEPQSGVAAAITARLFGLSVGDGSLLGRSLASGVSQTCHPPCGDWWHGVWGVDIHIEKQAHRTDDRPVSQAHSRHHASLVMHGEMVLQDCAKPNPDRQLASSPAVRDKD
jgi:hypothetical protein